MQRDQNPIARDTSLIPNAERDLPTMALADDTDQTIDLTAITTFVPTILLVRGDGDFFEGNDAPDQANDFWRDGGSGISLAVNGASTWHFKRKGSGTVNLYFKILGSL